MTTIDFEEIKSILVEKGFAFEGMVLPATQKFIMVEGRYNRDMSASISKITAGWVVGDFPKGIKVEIEINGNTKEEIINFLQLKYPGVKIVVRLD